MSYDCPCGTSVGTRAHWCEWKREQHAIRVERLLELQVSMVAAAEGMDVDEFRAIVRREAPRWDDRPELQG